MAKSYDNEIVEAEVSLAIERLLVAPHTYEWDPTGGQIDIGTPPSGFIDLGAVVEDSPTLTVTREKYQLELGLPRALQYEAVITLSGEMSCRIWGKSNDIVRRALGVDVTTISTIGSRAPFGTTVINKLALLGVADFTDGTQVVHYFPEVAVKAEYTEEIRPDAAGQIGLGFDCYSFISTIHGSERVVGERVYFEA